MRRVRDFAEIKGDAQKAAEDVQHALELAAEGGHPKVVRTLLRHHSEKDKAAMLRDALEKAASGGHEAAMRLLIAAGSDLDYTIYNAVPHVTCVKALIEVAQGAPKWKRSQVRRGVVHAPSQWSRPSLPPAGPLCRRPSCAGHASLVG